METSAETSRTPGARAAFNLACARLIVLGADADLTAPGAPFTVGVIREHAKRIRHAWSNRFGEGRTPEVKTIEAWATKSVPHPEAFGRLCRVIFGKAPDGHAGCRQLTDLHSKARAKAAGVPGPAPQTDFDTPDPRSPSVRATGTSFRDLTWTPMSQRQPDGLLELIVHPPTFGNEDPETARLPVTLSFDQVEDSVTHNRQRFDLRLGLTRAELRPEWSNCQPGFRSRPGQNGERPFTGNVAVRAGLFHITGPRPGGSSLVGDPFDGDTACTLEPSGKGEPRVTLTLTSTVNDVDVTVMRGKAASETVKAKLAKAWLLQRETRIENGRTVIWGKASLRGRRRPASS